MERVQKAGEVMSRPLSPFRLPLRAHFHRERETSGYEAGKNLRLRTCISQVSLTGFHINGNLSTKFG